MLVAGPAYRFFMTNKTADLSDLRVYQGAQTELAECGNYSEGTLRTVACRKYGASWGNLPAEALDALAKAPRLARCG